MLRVLDRYYRSAWRAFLPFKIKTNCDEHGYAGAELLCVNRERLNKRTDPDVTPGSAWNAYEGRNSAAWDELVLHEFGHVAIHQTIERQADPDAEFRKTSGWPPLNGDYDRYWFTYLGLPYDLNALSGSGPEAFRRLRNDGREPANELLADCMAQGAKPETVALYWRKYTFEGRCTSEGLRSGRAMLERRLP